jgi:hypothetical protein
METFGIFFGHFDILRPFGTFYGHLVILWQFDLFCPVLVYCVEKNLAALLKPLKSASCNVDSAGLARKQEK